MLWGESPLYEFESLKEISILNDRSDWQRDRQLREVLDGYAQFHQDKGLALDTHQPYLVPWVREFLLFARTHGGYSFEQTLNLFLAEVGGRVGTKPWQLQQASDAIRIYRYQYRGAKEGNNGSQNTQAFNGPQSLVILQP